MKEITIGNITLKPISVFLNSKDLSNYIATAIANIFNQEDEIADPDTGVELYKNIAYDNNQANIKTYKVLYLEYPENFYPCGETLFAKKILQLHEKYGGIVFIDTEEEYIVNRLVSNIDNDLICVFKNNEIFKQEK